jgi:hypothetical protein
LLWARKWLAANYFNTTRSKNVVVFKMT